MSGISVQHCCCSFFGCLCKLSSCQVKQHFAWCFGTSPPFLLPLLLLEFFLPICIYVFGTISMLSQRGLFLYSNKNSLLLVRYEDPAISFTNFQIPEQNITEPILGVFVLILHHCPSKWVHLIVCISCNSTK